MNIAVTVALLPALFPGGDGESSTETSVLISAPLAADPPTPTTTVVTAPPTTVPPTTVATAPPTTAAPKVAATPKRQAVASTPTTHTHPPKHTHTHTHAPKPSPTTTTTAAPPPPQQQGSSESGRATWYELEGARAGICAHKTLPFGTIVTVTNTNTGRSIRCEVGDRGPFVDGYVIDLFRTDFEQLAPTSSGWFPAKITW